MLAHPGGRSYLIKLQPQWKPNEKLKTKFSSSRKPNFCSNFKNIIITIIGQQGFCPIILITCNVKLKIVQIS